MNILKFFNYNKGISTPILLLSVVSIVVIAGSLIVFLQYPQTDTDKGIELNSAEQTEQIEQTKEKNQTEVETQELPKPLEPSEAEEQEARDARRKFDIKQIAVALELFALDAEAFFQSANMPSSIPVYMSEMPKDPVSDKDYKWIDNTKDSSKFCVYAELEQGEYYAGSHKGIKILNSPPENLSCW